MLEGIITALDGYKSRRQRAPDRIGRTVVGAAAAIRTGVKIKNMLPGKILKNFDAKRIQVIELLIRDAVAHRLDIALFNPHEKHVENGGNHMEVLAQRQKAQKKEKCQIMDKIGDQMRILQSSRRGTA